MRQKYLAFLLLSRYYSGTAEWRLWEQEQLIHHMSRHTTVSLPSLSSPLILLIYIPIFYLCCLTSIQSVPQHSSFFPIIHFPISLSLGVSNVLVCHLVSHVSECLWITRELLCSKQLTPYISHRPLGLSLTQCHTGDKERERERERQNRESLCPWSAQPAQWPFAHSSSEESARSRKNPTKILPLAPHFPYSFVLFEKMQALDFEEECVHVSVKAVDKQLWDVLRQYSLGFLSLTHCW